jgi:hypothetical protein
MTYPSTSNANGIWTLRDTFLARKGNIWPSALAPNLDPFFDYVSLLLSMDGDDASTTFTDSSNNNFSITAVGDAQISTSESKFGGASAAFDGTGDYLSIANNVAFQFGTGDFTVEGWFYASSQDKNFMTLFSIGWYTEGILLRRQNTSDNLYIAGSSYAYDQSYLPTGEWVHVALTRKSGQVILWLNGVQRLVATNTSNLVQTNNLFIGTSAHSLSDTWNGYIDDFRITKGFARYTADFTPPTLPFGTAAPVQLDPYFENYVSLLMHMDGTAGSQNFIDDGPLSLSVVEDTAVVIASSPAKFEQSADFPNGQYLQLENNTSPFYFDGPFTVEFWAYWDGTTAASSYMGVLGNHQLVNNQWAIYMRNSPPSYFMFTNNGYSFAYTPTITANEWQHIAITRDSNNTMRAFLNGVSGTAVSSVTLAFYLPNRMYIGWEQTSGRQTFQGYLDEIRITKGICRYSENFTPPTKAFPDTLLTNDLYFDNVSLLLPMDGTNGSTTFTDESNNGLTVTANGNAQISTSESKFGGASAYFDGTGDFLTIAHDAAIVFGSDSFTLECWVRPTSSSGGTIYSKRANTSTYAGLNLYAGVSNLYPALYVELGGGNFGWEIGATSSVALTLNGWNHVALVRNGSQWNLYINGVSGISATNSNSIYDDGSNAGIGAGNGASFPIEGYIDDFRITKGVARYTASFNPPTRALLNE